MDSDSGLVTAVGPGTAVITVRTVREGKKASCTVRVSAPDSSEGSGDPGLPPETSTFSPAVTFPVNHAANVAVSESIRFLYEQDIVKGDSFTGITLMDDTSGTSTAFTAELQGSVLVLTPSAGLKPGHAYTAALPAGALKTAAGDRTSAMTVLSFTTKADSGTPSTGTEGPGADGSSGNESSGGNNSPGNENSGGNNSPGNENSDDDNSDGSESSGNNNSDGSENSGDNNSDDTESPSGDNSSDSKTPDQDDDTENNADDADDNTDDGNPDQEDGPKIHKVSRLTIQAPSKKIAAGRSVALKVTVSPKNATTKKVKWKSDKPGYATVNSKGVVTTKKAGAGKTVTITATATDGSGKKASVRISILKHAVTKIQIKDAPKTLQAGKSVRLRAIVRTNGKNACKTVKWTTSNSKYAVVDANGKVKTKKAGKGKNIKITAISTDGTNKKAVVKIKLR